MSTAARVCRRLRLPSCRLPSGGHRTARSVTDAYGQAIRPRGVITSATATPRRVSCEDTRLRSGYVIFPQANVESEPSPLPDTERMRRELDLVDLAGEIGFDEFWVTEHHFGDYNLAPSPLQLLAYVTGRFPGASIGTMVIVLPW